MTRPFLEDDSIPNPLWTLRAAAGGYRLGIRTRPVSIAYMLLEAYGISEQLQSEIESREKRARTHRIPLTTPFNRKILLKVIYLGLAGTNVRDSSGTCAITQIKSCLGDENALVSPSMSTRCLTDAPKMNLRTYFPSSE